MAKTMLEDILQMIIEDKKGGLSDVEIGKKYNITYRQLERLITKATGVSISSFVQHKKIKTFEPKDFKEEATSVWSFKQRGNWATHSGEYRGNWSPYIPRNVILKYSNAGEIVLDYFCGAGTTAVEAKLLGRRCIALDINDKAIELARRNVDFDTSALFRKVYEPTLLVGDARDLSFLENNSIDLICAHPPYANIIHYTDHKEGDLSFYKIDEFLNEMLKVARESYRVLKPGRKCAILIGDMRRHKYIVPLGFKLINVYLDAGFKLKELVIKRQHNCKTTGFWYKNSIKYNFLLLAHEYLPIFEKPATSVVEVGGDLAVYSTLSPHIRKYAIKKALPELETTTVWLFPEDKINDYLLKNVIQRYGKSNYKIIEMDYIAQGNPLKQRGKTDLLFIRPPFFHEDRISKSEITFYCDTVKEIIIEELPFLNEKGFCIIQTRDLRLNGFIEPLAKRLVDIISINNLHLKEIVIVNLENKKELSGNKTELNTTHQYLLIYEHKG